MKLFVHIALIVTSLFSMTTVQATTSVPVKCSAIAATVAGAGLGHEATRSFLNQYPKQSPYLPAMICAASAALIASDLSYSFFSQAWINTLISSFINGACFGVFATSGFKVAHYIHEKVEHSRK